MNAIRTLLPLRGLLAIAILSPVWAAAESLQDAWSVATETDLVLQATEDRVAAAQAELRSANAMRLPTLSVGASVTRYRDTPAFDFAAAGLPVTLPLFDGSSMTMADLRVAAPIYTGGMVSAGRRAADANLSAARDALTSAGQDIRMQVAELYVEVLRADSALDVAQTNVTSGRAHLKDVQSMFDSGAVARNDLLAASVSLADAEQNALQAQNAADLARAAYNRALGRPLEQPVDLSQTLPDIDARLRGVTLPVLTELAMTYRAELAALGSAAQAYRERADATLARTRPQVGLSGGYTSLENQVLNREDFWSVGLGVRWNAFDSGRTRAEAHALERQSDALGSERRDLESRIELQVRQAWLQVRESTERTTVTSRAVEQAEENERVVRDRYRNGEGTNTEVLDAQSLRSLSRANYDNARFAAALSRYRLARAVGLL